MNQHFAEMLSALSAEDADFWVVGAYALAAHGYVRATGVLDIWVRCSSENAERVMRSITRFGAPLQGLTVEDLKTPDIVFQVGVAPVRIDLLTSIAGVDFDEAWQHRVMTKYAESEYPTLGRDHLIQNKRATGRPKDLNDALWLEGHAADNRED